MQQFGRSKRKYRQYNDKIIKLIAERSDYVRQAAYFKKSKTDVKVADRVEKIIKKVREKAKIYGCSPDVVELIYRDMINYFISEEMKTFEKNEQLIKKKLL